MSESRRKESVEGFRGLASRVDEGLEEHWSHLLDLRIAYNLRGAREDVISN